MVLHYSSLGHNCELLVLDLCFHTELSTRTGDAQPFRHAHSIDAKMRWRNIAERCVSHVHGDRTDATIDRMTGTRGINITPRTATATATLGSLCTQTVRLPSTKS